MGKLLATAAEEETQLRVLVHAAANVGMVIIIIIIIMKTYKSPLTEAQRRHTVHACTETKTNSNMLKSDKSLDLD